MIVPTIGVLSAILGAIWHAAIVRWLPQNMRIVSILGFDFFALIIVGFTVSTFDHIASADDWFTTLVLTMSLASAHMLVFTLVAYDSPTLSLTNAILDHGSLGMPIEALDEFSSRHPFIESRLASLVSAGIIKDDGHSLIFRGKVGLLLRVSEAYRRLCGSQAKGG